MRIVCAAAYAGAMGASLVEMLAGGAAVQGRTSISLRDYVTEMTAGGFPGMRHLDGRAL